MLDVGKWLKVFDYQNLENFFRSEKGKGSIGGSLGRVIVAFLIYQVPITIITIISLLILGSSTITQSLGGNGSELYGIFGTLMAGGGIVLVLVLSVVWFFVTLAVFVMDTGVRHIFAGLLGGKGTFSNLMHFASLVTAVGLLLALALDIIPALLDFIPMVGGAIGELLTCVLLPVGIVGWLYLLYATYQTVIVNYGLSSGRAIATVLLTLVFWAFVLAIVAGIIALLFGASLVALMSQMGGTSGYTGY